MVAAVKDGNYIEVEIRHCQQCTTGPADPKLTRCIDFPNVPLLCAKCAGKKRE